MAGFNPFARARQGSILGILGGLAQGQNPFAGLGASPDPVATSPETTPTAPMQTPMAPLNLPQQTDPKRLAYRQSIANIESSGGNYTALGPVTGSGDRAYGKYQVMGNNIGPWSEQALGRRLSASEFLRNDAAQDAVFDHVFGQYVDKYGEENAAQAWFGGEGSIGKTGRQDQLGTSVGSYGQRFMQGLSGNPSTPFTYANEKGNVNPAYTRALTTRLPGFTGLDRPTRDGTEGMTAGASPRRPTSQQPQLQTAQAERPEVGPTYDYGAEEVQGAAQEALARSKQGSQRGATRRELLKRRLRNEA